MRMVVASEERIKKAFRAAYEFMEKHNDILENLEDFKNLAAATREEYSKYEYDPLTRNLMYAVFSTVVEISDLVKNLGGNNDTARTIERP